MDLSDQRLQTISDAVTRIEALITSVQTCLEGAKQEIEIIKQHLGTVQSELETVPQEKQIRGDKRRRVVAGIGSSDIEHKSSPRIDDIELSHILSHEGLLSEVEDELGFPYGAGKLFAEVGLRNYFFSFLDLSSLLSLAQTCHRLKQLVDQSWAWRGFLAARYPRSVVRYSQETDWKEAYRHEHITASNFTKGKHQQIHIKTGEKMNFLQFNDHRLYSSSDLKITEWEPQGKSWKATSYFGAANQVRYFRFGGNNRLMISGLDTVRVYDFSTKDFLYQLENTFSPVTRLKFDENKIVTGSWDGFIKMWRTDNGQCTHTLTGHNNPIYCLDYNDRMILSGSSDKTIRVWDPNTTKFLGVLKGHIKTVNCVQFLDQSRLLSGSKDYWIKLWDVNTNSMAANILTHSSVNSIHLDFPRLISAQGDGSVRVFDLRRSIEELYKIEGHTASVNCVVSDDHRIISCGQDNSIRVWDFQPS